MPDLEFGASPYSLMLRRLLCHSVDGFELGAELGEFSKVLGDSGEEEFVTGAAGTAQRTRPLSCWI